MSNSEKQHFNPAVVEWGAPEEGIGIRLHLDHPSMESLTADERGQMIVALSRFALLCEYMVANQEQIAQDGLTPVNAFMLLAMSLQDLRTVFQKMAGEIDLQEIAER